MGLMDFLKKGEQKPAADTTPNQQNSAAPAQPVAQNTEPAPQPAEDTYTVVAGDSLSKIAKRFYGDEKQWQKLFEANKDQIKNPDLIYPGQVFKVPKG